MRTAYRIAVAVMALALAASPKAFAQDRLDIDAARRLALGRSSALAKASLAVESASLAKRASAYERLPSLGAQASGSFDYRAGAPLAEGLKGSLKLSATQAVYDARLSAAAMQSGIAEDAARENLRSVTVSLIGQADAAYYAVLKASAGVDAAAQDLSSARLRLRIAAVKLETGVLQKSDYLMTESEAARYETSLIKAENALSSARARLASLTGLPSSTELEPIDASAYDELLDRLAALDQAGAAAFSASVMDIAATYNPGLAGYALAVKKAGLALELARKGYAPTVTAGLSQSLAYDVSSGLSMGSPGISLSASIDLDAWKTANGVESAALASASAALDNADGSRVLALDISVAVNDLIGAGRTIASAAKALEYAENNYAYMFERFELSSASASDLSSAQALVSANAVALIGARYDFLSCLSALRGLAGLESEDLLVAAVP